MLQVLNKLLLTQNSRHSPHLEFSHLNEFNTPDSFDSQRENADFRPFCPLYNSKGMRVSAAEFETVRTVVS